MTKNILMAAGVSLFLVGCFDGPVIDDFVNDGTGSVTVDDQQVDINIVFDRSNKGQTEKTKTDPVIDFRVENVDYKDPALQTIQSYYEFLVTGELGKAYEISTRQASFDTFEDWYKSVDKIKLRNIESQGAGSYTFVSQITEGLVRNEYEVTMTADEEKILDTSSKKIKTTDMSTWPMYENQEFAFSIRYPFGWRYGWTTPVGAVEVALYPNQSQFFDQDHPAMMLSVREVGGDTSLEKWTAANISGSNIVEDETTLGGLPAQEFRNDKEGWVKAVAYFDNKIWLFSAYPGMGNDMEEKVAVEDAYLDVKKLLVIYGVDLQSVVDDDLDLSRCDEAPIVTSAGREVYPIDPKYKNTEFLGQIFTAFPCGEDRWNKIQGVKNGIYGLGLRISLFNTIEQQFINNLKGLGFVCMNDAPDELCLDWQLSESISVQDLWKLEPYHASMRADDCVFCG